MSAPARLLVTGGRQRQAVGLESVREWRLYDRALVLALELESGRVEERLGYESPPEHAPDTEPSYVFKAASAAGDELLVCTQTEVLVLSRDGRRVRRVLSHPLFNDLHHVVRREGHPDGRLHVACTGLDRLLVVAEDPSAPGGCRVEEMLGALPKAELRPLEPARDYRKVPTTKPHGAHPNFVFTTPRGRWLTRFEQKDAVCVDAPEHRLDVGLGSVHDGIAHAGEIWFTTVNGHLVAFDAASEGRTRHVDLNALEGGAAPLGWCRGLHIADGLAYVGFSRIRYTKVRRNLSWLKHGGKRAAGHVERPTRIAAFDLERGALLREWDLEPYGLNALFAILPEADPA